MAVTHGARLSRTHQSEQVAAMKQLQEVLRRSCGAKDVEALRVALEVARKARVSDEHVRAAAELLSGLELKMQPLALTDIPREEMQRLQTARSRQEIIEILMKCMGLSLTDGFQAEVLAEFHYHNFGFCQKHGLVCEQTSAFLSIMHQLHTRCIASETVDLPQAHALFEELMARHSRHLPPFSVEVFSRSEALLLKDFVHRSFFRHYKMYAFAYKHRVDFEIHTEDERVVPPLPVSAGLHKSFEVVDLKSDPDLQEMLLEADLDELSAGAAAIGAAAIAGTGGGGPGASGGMVRDADGSTNSPLARRGGHLSKDRHGGGPVVTAGSSPDSKHKAEVEAALDEAMRVHLGDMDARLAELPA